MGFEWHKIYFPSKGYTTITLIRIQGKGRSKGRSCWNDMCTYHSRQHRRSHNRTRKASYSSVDEYRQDKVVQWRHLCCVSWVHCRLKEPKRSCWTCEAISHKYDPQRSDEGKDGVVWRRRYISHGSTPTTMWTWLEGVNGVNRLATKGEKYYWLPTKRVKNYRPPTGKILTDYRHVLILSIFVSRKKSNLYLF